MTFDNLCRVKEDQPDLKEKKESLASKVHLDREVLLALKGQREVLAIQVSLDQTASLVSKDQKENQARTVWTAKQVKAEYQRQKAPVVAGVASVLLKG